MNKTEAIYFFDKKSSKARNKNVQLAYYNLVSTLRSEPSLGAAQAKIERLAKESDSADRRKVYRQALRDLRI